MNYFVENMNGSRFTELVVMLYGGYLLGNADAPFPVTLLLLGVCFGFAVVDLRDDN